MFKFCELEQNTIVKYVSFLTQSQDVEERIDVRSAEHRCGGLGTLKLVSLESK